MTDKASALEAARRILKGSSEPWWDEIDFKLVARAYIKQHEALEKIAGQELTADMSVDDQLGGDFEGAYDHIIELARATLTTDSDKKG